MPFIDYAGYYRAETHYAPLLREAGLIDGMSVFDHPKIVVWRSITERENAVLDHTRGDGSTVRLHIKRDKPAGRSAPSDAEAAGLKLLAAAGIAATPLVAHGRLNDGRGFVITEDLHGHRDAEKLIAAGHSFDRLLLPTARLAARLHAAGLHHRDLYLCHIFADPATDDVRLIDAARVRKLPRFFARRWVVKDLAQFLYSTRGLPISDTQCTAWFDAYATERGTRVQALRRSAAVKADRIARHDAALKRAQPGRGVSLDDVLPASPPRTPDRTIARP